MKHLIMFLFLIGFGTTFAIPPTISTSDNNDVAKISCVSQALTAGVSNFQMTDATFTVDAVPISFSGCLLNQAQDCNVEDLQSNNAVMVEKTKAVVTKYQVGALSFKTEADINASQNLKGKIIAISLPAQKIFSS
ncbi:MAG: hypothetical protein WC011_03060 [Candidatus Paceibacterota bacterium]